MPDTLPTARVITPRGRGAVATVVLEGAADRVDQTGLFRAANGLPVERQALQQIIFGAWGSEPSEHVVLCRTAADEIEVHCHGGDAAVRRILADLQQSGYQAIAWEEAAAQPACTLAAECAAAVTRAPTLRTAAIALDQASGLLQQAYAELRIDAWDAASRAAAAEKIEALLRWANFGRHLCQPWRVVLAGQPNVGKSSLINALVGFSRAVVHDRPGTTRDVVTAETALEGWPIQLADTAGIREAAERIEASGIELAQTAFAAADCRILVLDRSVAPDADVRRLMSAWPDAILVANKCDLDDAWGETLPAETLLTSVASGEGLKALAGTIVQRLVPVPPPGGTAVPVSERQCTLLEAARTALSAANRNDYMQSIDRLFEHP